MNPNVDPSWGSTGANERHKAWMEEQRLIACGWLRQRTEIRNLPETPHPKGLE